MMSKTLGQLAVEFGCALRGEPELRVTGVATLAGARSGQVAFLANRRYLSQLRTTGATAVVVDAGAARDCPVAALICPNPYATYARIAAQLHPTPAMLAGVHPSAVIDPSAEIHPTARIDALAFIGAGAVIGERSQVGPGCVIEPGVRLGADSHLVARVTLGRDVEIGPRSIVHPGAVIGSDGFGFAGEHGKWIKVPQVGRVVIGADVEIGANTTIDRGAIEDTVIGDGVKIDNLVQIGHNVRVGAHSAIAGCVGISGSVTIGERCQIGGAVGIAGHLSIADDVAVTGLSLVSKSLTEPGIYSSGVPAQGAAQWRRTIGRLRRLDAIEARLAKLERSDTAVRSPDTASRHD